MSITLGFYDVFSYAVPGMFYLYLVNETLKLCGFLYIDWTKLTQSGDFAPNALIILALGLASFVTGHLFEGIRSILLDRRFYYGAPELALGKLKKRLASSGVSMGFNPAEWAVYKEVLKIRNAEANQSLESLKAVTLMLRNFTFGAVLFSLLQLVQFFRDTNSFYFLAFCALALLTAYFLHRRAWQFDEWLFRNLYLDALVYGNSLKEVLENSEPKWKQIGRAHV